MYAAPCSSTVCPAVCPAVCSSTVSTPRTLRPRRERVQIFSDLQISRQKEKQELEARFKGRPFRRVFASLYYKVRYHDRIGQAIYYPVEYELTASELRVLEQEHSDRSRSRRKEREELASRFKGRPFRLAFARISTKLRSNWSFYSPIDPS
jgi:hypothetical protein